MNELPDIEAACELCHFAYIYMNPDRTSSPCMKTKCDGTIRRLVRNVPQSEWLEMSHKQQAELLMREPAKDEVQP